MFLHSSFAGDKPPAGLPVFRPNAAGSHTIAIERVKKSQNQALTQVIDTYEVFIRSYPKDIDTRIEFCEFLRDVLDDEMFSEVPVNKKLDDQMLELKERFPDDRRAVVMRSTVLPADSAIALLEGYLKRHKEDSTEHAPWDISERLAEEYESKDQPYKAMHYASEAMLGNDTLDMTLLIARQCQMVGESKVALTYLRRFKDKASSSWMDQQKAEMFLALGANEEAAALFQRALSGEDWPGTLISMAKSLEELGKLDEARSSLLKALSKSYTKDAPATALFLFDLHHSPADSALQSYEQMRDQGFETDPLARHRIALFLAHPFLPWRFRDFGGILLLNFMFLVAEFAPGLLVVPVHYAGMLRKITPHEPTRWNLSHFWLLCSFLMMSGAVAMLVFGYGELTLRFGESLFGTGTREQAELAGQTLTYWILFYLACLAFVRRKDFRSVWGGRWSKAKSIFSGIGWMLIVRFVFGVAVLIYILFFLPEGFPGRRYEFFQPLSASSFEILVAVRRTIGWFPFVVAVAILAPVFEELAFRGIALRSFQRYIPFGWANFLQALLFAVLHFELVLSLFAFAVGIVSGILRNRSSSLVPSIALHMSNNLIAAVAIAVMF